MAKTILGPPGHEGLIYFFLFLPLYSVLLLVKDQLWCVWMQLKIAVFNWTILLLQGLFLPSVNAALPNAASAMNLNQWCNYISADGWIGNVFFAAIHLKQRIEV